MTCFSCGSKKEADDSSPYLPPAKTKPDEIPLQQTSKGRNKNQVTYTNDGGDETQPLTHTEVKTSKSGNTVTEVRTTRTRVLKTQPAKTCPDEFPLQQTSIGQHENQITYTNDDGDEMQPLTQTQVKTSKSGNTVTVVRTTRTQVLKTQQAVVTEQDLNSGPYERVYQATVTKAPPAKRKRFNLKSVLSRNAIKKVKPSEQNEQLQERCLWAHNQFRAMHGIKPLVLNKELCQYATDWAHTNSTIFNLKSVLSRNAINKVQPSDQNDQVQERCLWAHNKYRAMHGIKPLVLSKELCQYAADWAHHLAKKNILQQRKKNKYGENLAMGTGTTYNPEDAVQSWYDEMEHYDFKKPGFSSQTGHFSQVVWQESTQLGVGVAQKDNRTWIVCNYDPAGNVLGQYVDNVVAPKGRKGKPKPLDVVDKKKLEEGREDTKPSTSQAFKKVEINKNQKWSKFELECLESHNKLRAQHGCAPLTLNKSLCNLANDWATHLTKIRTMYHRPQNEYGENIYQITNRDPAAEDAVKGWYDEIQKYKFKKPGFSMGTGHFTQVVWLDSTELGVGKAKVDNITFVVCNYNPPGNVMGQYNTQVPPVGGFKNGNVTTNPNNTTTTTTTKDCSDNNNKTTDLNGHPPELSKKKSGFFSNWFKSKKAK